MLRGVFEHKTLKPTIIRTNQGNVQNLAELKQIMKHGTETKPKFLHILVKQIRYYRINFNISTTQINR